MFKNEHPSLLNCYLMENPICCSEKTDFMLNDFGDYIANHNFSEVAEK